MLPPFAIPFSAGSRSAAFSIRPHLAPEEPRNSLKPQLENRLPRQLAKPGSATKVAAR
jgi:hypothetical protein